MGQIPDDVCIAALETVLKPLGTSMRHYSFEKTRNAAIEAMRQIMLAERERCAGVAESDWERAGEFIAAAIRSGE